MCLECKKKFAIVYLGKKIRFSYGNFRYSVEKFAIVCLGKKLGFHTEIIVIPF